MPPYEHCSVTDFHVVAHSAARLTTGSPWLGGREAAGSAPVTKTEKGCLHTV